MKRITVESHATKSWKVRCNAKEYKAMSCIHGLPVHGREKQNNHPVRVLSM